MRHASRYLPHDGRAIGVHEVLLHPLQHCFGATMVADLSLQSVACQTEIAGALFHAFFQFYLCTLCIGDACRDFLPAT